MVDIDKFEGQNEDTRTLIVNEHSPGMEVLVNLKDRIKTRS